MEKKEIDKDVIRIRAAVAIRLAGEPLNNSGTDNSFSIGAKGRSFA